MDALTSILMTALVLFIGGFFYVMVTLASRKSIDLSKAAEAVKSAAGHHPMNIELSQQQLETLKTQWDKIPANEPAQLVIMVNGNKAGELAIVG